MRSRAGLAAYRREREPELGRQRSAGHVGFVGVHVHLCALPFDAAVLRGLKSKHVRIFNDSTFCRGAIAVTADGYVTLQARRSRGSLNGILISLPVFGRTSTRMHARCTHSCPWPNCFVQVSDIDCGVAPPPVFQRLVRRNRE